MPIYTVSLERTVVTSAQVEVEADNEDEAMKVAEDEAQKQIGGEKSNLPTIDWSELESDTVEADYVEELEE